MKSSIKQMLVGAFCAASIASLAACKGETATTVNAQTIATFESTYVALSSAGISYAGTTGAKPAIVADIVKANDVVYPYVTALRQAAENGGTVSTSVFAAATVALSQFGSAINETGAKVSVPATVATAQ